MSAVGRVFRFLGDSSLPSALAAPASLRPHRPRLLDPGDLRSWWGRGRAGQGGFAILGWGALAWGLDIGAGAGLSWGRGWGLDVGWLSWAGHGLGMAGIDGAGLGEGRGLGGARPGLGGSELVLEGPELLPLDAPS